MGTCLNIRQNQALTLGESEEPHVNLHRIKIADNMCALAGACSLGKKKKGEQLREGGGLQHKRNTKDEDRKCCCSRLSLTGAEERWRCILWWWRCHKWGKHYMWDYQAMCQLLSHTTEAQVLTQCSWEFLKKYYFALRTLFYPNLGINIQGMCIHKIKKRKCYMAV